MTFFRWHGKEALKDVAIAFAGHFMVILKLGRYEFVIFRNVKHKNAPKLAKGEIGSLAGVEYDSEIEYPSTSSVSDRPAQAGKEGKRD